MNWQKQSTIIWLSLFKNGNNLYENENSKTIEPGTFRLPLANKLNLKDPNKNMALANLSIYYTWKNIKSAYNNNKFEIFAQTWNDEFDVPDGGYSISEI